MSEPLRAQLGRHIAEVCGDLDITYRDLANKLGVSETNLYHAIRGNKGSIALYEAIARELGFDYIVGRKE